MPASSAPRSASPSGAPGRARTAAVTAVGHFLPEERLTNADLEGMVDTSDEWIRQRTGIRERRILRDPDKATSYMATRAAEELLDKRGIGADELDAIIVGTVTPDMFYPATACLVQNELGATNAFGYDLSAACSGFLFALGAGAGHVEGGQCDKVLVIGADKMSSIVDYTDRSTCILFGDGAGAVLLEPSRAAGAEGRGLHDMHQRVDGSEWHNLCQPGGGSRQPPTHQSIDEREHFLKQNGRPVFKQAVRRMAEASTHVMERNGLAPEDLDYLVPHQANRRIIEATARQMDLPPEKAMMNIGRYGNTTAGTIPLCLHDWEADLRAGDRLILTTFGGGYTWGAGLLEWAYDGSSFSIAD